MHGMCEDGFATGCWRCAPVAHLRYCTVLYCTALCCIGAGNLIDVEDVRDQIRYIFKRSGFHLVIDLCIMTTPSSCHQKLCDLALPREICNVVGGEFGWLVRVEMCTVDVQTLF